MVENSVSLKIILNKSNTVKMALKSDSSKR
jgi:hypothetical protein